MLEWLKGDLELKRTKKRGWVVVYNDVVDMHLSHELLFDYKDYARFKLLTNSPYYL